MIYKGHKPSSLALICNACGSSVRQGRFPGRFLLTSCFDMKRDEAKSPPAYHNYDVFSASLVS